ncbi:MAG: 30S ribosomal protein S20 [Parcubacteria group bacterium]|nr:30S ribosomal protein S20 [Parcubacteria group bacterium]
MPIKSSAKKALRQTKKRTLANQAAGSAIRDLEKKLVKEITAKKTGEIKSTASALVQRWDKAVKNNIISRNTASRKKSRLQKIINKIL